MPGVPGVHAWAPDSGLTFWRHIQADNEAIPRLFPSGFPQAVGSSEPRLFGLRTAQEVEMDDRKTREHIQAHADAVVRGDMDTVVADFSEELRP